MIVELEEEFRRRYHETSLIVVLLGAGRRGLELRRRIKRRLRREGIIALVPEDDFPPHIAPDLAERSMLRRGDVELVFVNVESWGSATEFGQFHMDEGIAPKLRVLVHHRHHPLHGRSRSYLTDVYLIHLAVHGHVYPYGRFGERGFLPVEEVV